MRLIARILCGLLLATTAYGAQQVINVGAAPNDGTGDPARTAFQKVNADFTDLYSFLYAPITGPVTIASGTNTSAIGANVLTNGNFAFMPGQTIKCNLSVSPAAMSDCTAAQINSLLGTGGGGGGTGTLTNFTFTAPAPFTVTGANPFSVDGSTFSLSWTPGQSANLFLATPCGATGPVGLRALCTGDLPNLVGQVTSSGGTTSIAASSVTNAQLANANASSIKCNPTGGVAAVQDCTVAQINQLIGNTAGGGGSGLSNQVDLCTYPGIDNTGTNDSQAGVVNAFAAVAGTNQELEVNCPVRIVIGYNPTKPIFVASGTNLRFGPKGAFIVDNSTIPAFVFLNASDITWIDANFQYVGALPINNAVAPYLNVSAGFNNSQILNYMTNTLGFSFSGGATPFWPGATNMSALLLLSGPSQRITFIHPKFYVSQTTAATGFIPVVAAIEANWSGTTKAINASTPQVAPTLNYPSDITWIEPELDGYYMGFVGGGTSNYISPKFYRYSDLQDSSGGTQGGVGQWFAPPHAIYLVNTDVSFNCHNLISNGYDYGIYVGGATRRTTGSGSLLSLKLDVTNGTVVNGYTTFRPDGAFDLLQNNSGETLGGTVNDFTAYYNSQTATANGGSVWGLRFPSGNGYFKLNIHNLTITDLAATPMQFPIVGSTQSGTTDVSITGLKVWMNDFPTSAANSPGFPFSGTNVSVEGEYHFLSMSTTTTFLGPVANTGSAYCVGCNYDFKVFGWRQFPVTFSAALASGATGGTLAASWPYSSGTYTIQFPDEETRTATFTSGSTTVGAWSPGLTAAQTAAGSSAGGSLLSNFNGYKPAILVNYNGGSMNSRAHILDVANSYEAFSENGTLTEYWSQLYHGTPSGATQSTGMVFPNTMSAVSDGLFVNSAVSGATSLTLGWTGNTTALRTGIGVSGSTNPALPLTTPVTFPNNPTTVNIYCVGGNCTGGTVTATVRGAQMSEAR